MKCDPDEHEVSRRKVLAGGAAFLAIPVMAARAGQASVLTEGPLDAFPRQDPAEVAEVVGKSHFDLERVKVLVEARPALARSAIDWGFGDWESALGAASHTGQREIASVLMAHGARPNLFTHAMLGHLDVVRAEIDAVPGIERIAGPHGLSLMRHARAGGQAAEAVVAYLETLPGADGGGAVLVLQEEDLTQYRGEYIFGPGVNDRLVTGVRQGQLTLARKNGVARSLTPVSPRVFHPAGAEAVRIVFEVTGDFARSVTVHDPGPIVTAFRV